MKKLLQTTMTFCLAFNVATIQAASCDLTIGNDYQKLDCLPHLEQVRFKESYNSFKKYNRTKVKVAILDGEFNQDHPNLKIKLRQGFDANINGCTSVRKKSCAYDFNPNDVPSDSRYLGTFNHGTSIAGVIAAYGRGLVGVNPSAQLLPISTDYRSHHKNALRAAIDAKVDVISMSFRLGNGAQRGTGVHVADFEKLIKEAIRKGIVVVMAAGNAGLDVNSTAVYPTRYSKIGGVIAVAGIDADGKVHKKSNYGNRYVDVAAPFFVATAGGNYEDADYSFTAGTSFSGPMVAAAASRVIQMLKYHKIKYSASTVENLIRNGTVNRKGLSAYVRTGALDMVQLKRVVDKFIKSKKSSSKRRKSRRR